MDDEDKSSSSMPPPTLPSGGEKVIAPAHFSGLNMPSPISFKGDESPKVKATLNGPMMPPPTVKGAMKGPSMPPPTVHPKTDDSFPMPTPKKKETSAKQRSEESAAEEKKEMADFVPPAQKQVPKPRSDQDLKGPKLSKPQPGTSHERQKASLGFRPPAWATEPRFECRFDVLRGGVMLDPLLLDAAAALTVGRAGAGADLELGHPSTSRLHAAIVHGERGVFLVDLGSTHGTCIGKRRVPPREYVPLRTGDVVKFGQSTRLHVFEGPEELRPQEDEPEALREKRAAVNAKRAARERRREEERRRGAEQAARRGEVSWGFGEDAVDSDDEEGPEGEEDEEDLPDYLKNDPHRAKYKAAKVGVKKSEVNRKDMELFDKMQEKVQKINKLQTEIQRILAKEGGQAGLTQGQQDAITRNEKKVESLKEEIEELESTIHNKNKQRADTKSQLGAKQAKEDAYNSEDDDFYDRTKTHQPASAGEENGAAAPRRRRGLRGYVTQKARGGAAAAAAPAAAAETLESLQEQAARARAEAAALREDVARQREREAAAAAAAEGAAAGSGAAAAAVAAAAPTLDPLDAFMAETAARTSSEDAAGKERRAAALERELGRLERLIEISRPALPGLSAAPRRGALALQPKPSKGGAVADDPKPGPIAGGVQRGPQQSGASSSAPAQTRKNTNVPPAESSETAGQMAMGSTSSRQMAAATEQQRAGASEEDDAKNVSATRAESNKPKESSSKTDRKNIRNDAEKIFDNFYGDPSEKSSTPTGNAETCPVPSKRLQTSDSTLEAEEKKNDEAAMPSPVAGKGVPPNAGCGKNAQGKSRKRKVAAAAPRPGPPSANTPAPTAASNGGGGEALLEGGDAAWVPPKHQSGDGRTHLNAKFGY